MHIDRLDHLVLTVRSIEATCNFYTRVLGMTVIRFGNGRQALQFGSQEINLHESGKEFEPKAKHPTPGSADLCFITSVPLADVLAQQNRMIQLADGPLGEPPVAAGWNQLRQARCNGLEALAVELRMQDLLTR